jgi:hypothetical protein
MATSPATITPVANHLTVASAAEPLVKLVVVVVDAPAPMAAATLISSPANVLEDTAKVASNTNMAVFIAVSICDCSFLAKQDMASNRQSVKLYV